MWWHSRLAFDRAMGAFSSNRIVVSPFDGSDSVTLQGGPVTGSAPAWAPDGSLLFSCLFEMQQGEYGLEPFDTSGGPSRPIPAEGHLGYDSWQVVRSEPQTDRHPSLGDREPGALGRHH